jgi:3-isopropylmalate/(R)-2-methylmalate dehydratase small subunit
VEPVHRVSGTGVPLKRSDVDTDQIIPARWLKRIERTGFGTGLFSAWREDPEFVLNQPQYQGGSILLTGPNFGCGSSREHAVWALEESGFYAVISASLADIFRANALRNGLLAVELPQSIVTTIVEAVEKDPRTEITIDVEQRKVSVPSIGVDEEFELNDFAQYRLLNGLDDIALTLQKQDEISAFEAERPSFRPAIADR